MIMMMEILMRMLVMMGSYDSGTIDAMHFFECNPEFDHE